MTLVPALLGVALAQSTPDAITVRVAIDDRTAAILEAPTLEVEQDGVVPVRFSDDGHVEGDRVEDRIHMAAVKLAQTEKLTFRVRDRGEVLGSFDVSLPSSGTADFALKTVKGDPPLVIDFAAPPIPGGSGGPGLLLGADGAEDGDEDGAAADQISLRVFVDDRAVARLQEPRVVVDEEGATPSLLFDDGSLEGDAARDRIFLGELTVARAEYVTLVVEDLGLPVGRAKVFLPSTTEAEVHLVTLDGGEGLELKSEPTATGGTDGPAVGSSAMAPGRDRFVHVLWVAIAMFAMGLAYVRSVVATRWEQDVRPLLERLRRHLDTVASGEE